MSFTTNIEIKFLRVVAKFIDLLCYWVQQLFLRYLIVLSTIKVFQHTGRFGI